MAFLRFIPLRMVVTLDIAIQKKMHNRGLSCKFWIPSHWKLKVVLRAPHTNGMLLTNRCSQTERGPSRRTRRQTRRMAFNLKWCSIPIRIRMPVQTGIPTQIRYRLRMAQKMTLQRVFRSFVQYLTIIRYWPIRWEGHCWSRHFGTSGQQF